MNRNYVEHDGTGRIICVMNLTDGVYAHNCTLNPYLVQGDGDPATHYVKAGQVVARPAQDTLLEAATLRHLPVPCRIRINDKEYDCTDDHAELMFTLPGTYRIVVTAWPYLDKEFMYENPSR